MDESMQENKNNKKPQRLLRLWWSIGESPLGARRASVRPALTCHWHVIHFEPRFDSPSKTSE